ncbi:MAG: hypothetical protein PVJ21_15280 [Anaerolineales bacterium]|jgi:hypothetical protein
MRINSKTVRIAIWVLLGIALLVSNLALNRSLPSNQDATATPASQSSTMTAEAQALEEAGSTDGIMFVAVLIVLIVIIPILLRRQDWINGKRK